MRPRLGSILLAAVLAACAGSQPPARFLPADTGDWNSYLNAVVDVNLRNIPLGDLAQYAPFQQLTITLSGVDPAYRVTLEIKQVSRRQALWMLARQYGLTMTVVKPYAIVISNT
jgi:hypothetical protein